MIDIKQYQYVIFKFDELLRKLLLESDDVLSEEVGYWIKCWEKIESENEEVFHETFKDN